MLTSNTDASEEAKQKSRKRYWDLMFKLRAELKEKNNAAPISTV